MSDVVPHLKGMRSAATHAPKARTETGEAPPAADEANRFRGSGTIGTPNRRGNRNAVTVDCGARSFFWHAQVAPKNDLNLFAAVRGGLGSRWQLRCLTDAAHPLWVKVCDAFPFHGSFAEFCARRHGKIKIVNRRDRRVAIYTSHGAECARLWRMHAAQCKPSPKAAAPLLEE